MTTPLYALLAGLLGASSALAHEGHGLEGAHSHPSDVWGLMLMGLAMAFTAWFFRKK
jgi:hypothetical protein